MNTDRAIAIKLTHRQAASASAAAVSAFPASVSGNPLEARVQLAAAAQSFRAAADAADALSRLLEADPEASL